MSRVRAPRRRSLFWTLSASMLAVLVLAVLLQWIVVVALVEPGARRWQSARQSFVAERTATAISEALARDARAEVPRLLAEAERELEPARVFLYLSDGRWIGSMPMTQGWSRHLERMRRDLEGAEHEAPDAAPPVAPRRQGPAPMGPPRLFADARLVVGAPVALPDGGQAELFVAAPRVRWRVLALLPRQAALFLPIAVLVAALAALLVSHRLQRRIARLDAMAARIGEGDLHARVDAPGEDEIGALGRQLNAMAERLQGARDHVQALERERSRLLADISHDLLTPLTTIRGFAETLLDERVQTTDEQRRRYLQSMSEGAARMDRLLADLMDLARLESRAQEFDLEPIDLASLVRHSVERFAPSFERQGLVLDYVGPADGVMVRADGHRMEQVVDNLLGNALRHAAPAAATAPLRVRVCVDERAGDPRRVAMIVEDEGPGIPPADLPFVFDRFYRADRARSRSGSGLGLAIAREIVLRHDGTIAAENRPEGGARFTVVVPGL